MMENRGLEVYFMPREEQLVLSLCRKIERVIRG